MTNAPRRPVRTLLASLVAASLGGALLVMAGAPSRAGAEWTNPASLSATGSNVANVEVAYGLEGTRAAAWEQGSNVMVDVKRPGEPWMGPVAMPGLPAGAFNRDEKPDVAVTESGEVLVVWVRRVDGLNDTLYGGVVRTDLGGWTATDALSDESTVQVNGHPALATGAGRGFATFLSYNSGDTEHQVSAVLWDSSLGWGSAESAQADSADDASAPALGMSDTGHVAIAWLLGNRVYAASGPNATPTAPSAVGGPGSYGPSVSVSANETLVGYTASDDEVEVKGRAHGEGGWSLQTNAVVPSAGSVMGRARVAVADDGSAVLAYERSDSFTRIYARTRNPLGSWGREVVLTGGSAFLSRDQAQPVWADINRVGVTYSQPDRSGQQRAWAVSKPHGQRWGRAQALSARLDTLIPFPDVAARRDGRVFVGWNGFDGTWVRTQVTDYRQPTTMRLRAKPKRDKKAPFKYKLRGSIDTEVPGIRCSGRVKIVVKQGKRKVATKRTKMRPSCTFAKTVKINGKKIKGKRNRSRKLSVVATWPGASELQAAKKRIIVRAR